MERFFMPRTSITFDTETFSKLHITAKNKKITLSSYVRELVAIGLKVEDMSQNKAENDSEKSDFTLSNEEKMLWKNCLLWQRESLYLVRNLVKDLLKKNNQTSLDNAKQSAQMYVDGLLQEQI